jgi:WD40 repeat protein
VGTSDGCVMLWDLRTQRELRAYDGHSGGISVTRIDAGGRWLLSADLDGRMCLHELQAKACHTELLGHATGKAIRRGRFLADGRVVTSSDDGTVRLWAPPYGLSDDELACELARRAFRPAGAPAPVCGAAAERAYRGR